MKGFVENLKLFGFGFICLVGGLGLLISSRYISPEPGQVVVMPSGGTIKVHGKDYKVQFQPIAAGNRGILSIESSSERSVDVSTDFWSRIVNSTPSDSQEPGVLLRILPRNSQSPVHVMLFKDKPGIGSAPVGNLIILYRTPLHQKGRLHAPDPNVSTT
jgi:hypothetical protein